MVVCCIVKHINRCARAAYRWGKDPRAKFLAHSWLKSGAKFLANSSVEIWGEILVDCCVEPIPEHDRKKL